MQHLSCTFTDDKYSEPAIGLVVLQSDETMEHELRQWLPATYRLFHTRIPNSQQINAHTLRAMKEKLPESVSLLPQNTQYRVIAYGCTSASTLIGEAAVTTGIQSIVGTATAVTNPVSAIKAQLRHLDAKRIALLTPYTADISAALVSNLENSGHSIVHSASFNEAEDHRVARISAQSLHDAIRQLGSNDDIDAVVASCTNLRTYDVLPEASQIIGRPVISSNSALAWHIRQLLTTVNDHGFDHSR